jgi:hypothetical protein
MNAHRIKTRRVTQLSLNHFEFTHGQTQKSTTKKRFLNLSPSCEEEDDENDDDDDRYRLSRRVDPAGRRDQHTIS